MSRKLASRKAARTHWEGDLMGYVITLDTGTTNTRATLLRHSGEVVAQVSTAVGVRDTAITGSNKKLTLAVRDALSKLVEDEGITFRDVKRIMASGMITSNVGLVEIPHITAPVTMNDLALQVQEILIPDICPIPLCFIPGVKNSDQPVTQETAAAMDIMRGEETEVWGVTPQLTPGKPALLVLPGSHMKFVALDEEQRITGCMTSISGELLDCIVKNTIIADSTNRLFPTEDIYDREMVLEGYESGRAQGLGRACFTGRIISQFAHLSPEAVANFILGAVLSCDIQAITSNTCITVPENAQVVIAGKNPFRQAMADIMTHAKLFGQVQTLVPDSRLPLSAAGALAIAGAMDHTDNLTA